MIIFSAGDVESSRSTKGLNRMPFTNDRPIEVGIAASETPLAAWPTQHECGDDALVPSRCPGLTLDG